MKASFKKFVLAAVCAAACLGGTAMLAQAKYKSPIWDMRRTLNMSFGQHRIALEAPLGMCFMDESQYMEATLIKQLRTMSQQSGDGLVMAVFADCKEIEKFAQLPELAADTPPGVDPPTANLDNRGTINWLAPKLGRAPLSLEEYLDMREPGFRDEVKGSVTKSYNKFGGMQSIKMADNVTASLLMGSPEDYVFDDRANRTGQGLSISYSSEFISEYVKHHQFGAIGTTMLRHFPVQVMISQDGKGRAKDQEQLKAMLAEYLAQIATLNP